MLRRGQNVLHSIHTNSLTISIISLMRLLRDYHTNNTIEVLLSGFIQPFEAIKGPHFSSQCNSINVKKELILQFCLINISITSNSEVHTPFTYAIPVLVKRWRRTAEAHRSQGATPSHERKNNTSKFQGR